MPRASGSLLSHRQHWVVVTTTDSSTTLIVLDLVGIFVFAIAGGLVAVRKGLDVFGVLVLAGTTGLGGGFLRDVLIGAAPPAALEDWRYLVVPVVAGLLAFLYHPALGRMERSINVLDAFGLGLFCVTGALKAMDYGLGPVPSALMGMVTGIGGGMIRDVLAGRVPAVFRGRALRHARAGRRRRGGRRHPPRRAGRGRRLRRRRAVHRLAAGRHLAALAGADLGRSGERLSRWARSAISRRGPGAGRGWRRPGPGRACRAGRGTPRSGGTSGPGRPQSGCAPCPSAGGRRAARMIGSTSAK